MDSDDTYLSVREATTEDLNAIIAITKAEKLWSGLDYLVPSLLMKWLEEGQRDNKQKCNLVFLLPSQRIVGFWSFIFTNGGTLAHEKAGRICSSVRGKGIGRIVMKLAHEYVLEKYPSITQFLDAIPDFNMTDEQVQSPKHGKLLTKMADLVIEDDLSEIKAKLMTITKRTKHRKPKYSFIDRDDFRQLLKLPSAFSEDFLDNDVLCICWYPYFLSDEEHIETLFNQGFQVLVEGSLKEGVKSVSIFSPLYLENVGGHRSTLHLFYPKSREYEGDLQDSILTHFTRQINELIDTNASCNGTHYFEIIAREPIMHVVFQLFKEADVSSFLIRGNQGRPCDSMYIYLKNK